jgi:hypothetical protein
MRVLAFMLAASLLTAAGTASACPMESAAKNQTLASSNANSTPIPQKSRQGS